MQKHIDGGTSPRLARRAIREGKWSGVTTGISNGYAQGNLAVIPQAYAADFMRFCMFNRAPCPILDVTAPGTPFTENLGEDIDLRTDLPRYRVFKDGNPIDEPSDLLSQWRDDLVAFVIGCSHSFEESLEQEGVPLRHREDGRAVPVYRTNIPLKPAGPFHGNCVVSMRPMPPADVIRAIQITTDMPSVHGAPVHIGHPEMIGIEDISSPDFGDAPVMKDGDIPVFWACGVTPQIVLMNACLPLALTHAPGNMLITDVPNHSLKYR